MSSILLQMIFTPKQSGGSSRFAIFKLQESVSEHQCDTKGAELFSRTTAQAVNGQTFPCQGRSLWSPSSCCKPFNCAGSYEPADYGSVHKKKKEKQQAVHPRGSQVPQSTQHAPPPTRLLNALLNSSLLDSSSNQYFLYVTD